jgi:arylsulfatase A-like enzyme
MIRSKRFKYCVYNDGEVRESLVDMKNDPGEMKNLASKPEYENMLIEHQRYLEHWIEESGDREAKSFAVIVNRVDIGTKFQQ